MQRRREYAWCCSIGLVWLVGWYHQGRCAQGVESDRQDKPLSEVHAMFTVETGVSAAKIGHFRSARESVNTQCFWKSQPPPKRPFPEPKRKFHRREGSLNMGFPPPGKPALGTPTAETGGFRRSQKMLPVLTTRFSFRPGGGMRTERGLWQGGAGGEQSQHGASLGRVAARLRGGRRGA